jgi:hypothetical protein
MITAAIGARGSAVFLGTKLQAGRSRFRFPITLMDFSIDLIFPAALWSWDRLSLYQKWVPGIFLGCKGRPERKADSIAAICGPMFTTKCGSLDVSKHYGLPRPVTGVDLFLLLLLLVLIAVIPCGGGVEYLYRSPASRRRRQKGKSRIWDSKIWSRVPRD